MRKYEDAFANAIYERLIHEVWSSQSQCRRGRETGRPRVAIKIER
jgi:hypothetical protein